MTGACTNRYTTREFKKLQTNRFRPINERWEEETVQLPVISDLLVHYEYISRFRHSTQNKIEADDRKKDVQDEPRPKGK